ncbi:MAG: hypothetical protein Q9178_002526 [Gyalolechia marmorata]
MYRAFSTAARAAKNITWTLNGTTQDINAALTGLQQALDTVPELAQKVEKGRADGTVDPIHISGVLGKGNLKGSKRATSFHLYLECADLVFSNEKYQPIRVLLPGTQAAQSSSTQPAAHIPAHQQASDWVWDENAQKYMYWNGFEWVLQE